MVSEKNLLKLVSEYFPELDDSIIPQINSKHDEILLIAEAAEELKNLAVFHNKVESELLLKRSIDPVNSVLNALIESLK